MIKGNFFDLTVSNALKDVLVLQFKDKCKNLVGQVISDPDNENDFKLKFIRQSSEVKNVLCLQNWRTWHQSQYDIKCVLSKPLPVAHRSKLLNVYSFSENLDEYSV